MKFFAHLKVLCKGIDISSLGIGGIYLGPEIETLFIVIDTILPLVKIGDLER